MIDIEIDKLTNSIEEVVSGRSFETSVIKVSVADFDLIASMSWDFDWKKEQTIAKKEVYKLVTEKEPNIIQGLISIEDKKDHIFIHLIENANHNKNKDRKYLGVAGNLIAFACKQSFESGYDGFVSFISKTILKQHYQKTLGAKLLFGDTMVIETPEAQLLVDKYFKK